MPYCSASDVAILVQNVLGGQELFSTSTSPINKAVTRWMSSGCSVIENRLKAAGYAMPAASTTSVYGELVDCNALYAAARVEMSRSNVTLGPGERTRGQVFLEMFEDCLKGLINQDLTLAGLSQVSNGQIFVGGISIAQRQLEESDTDRIEPRFSRGQFDSNRIIKPSTTTAS